MTTFSEISDLKVAMNLRMRKTTMLMVLYQNVALSHKKYLSNMIDMLLVTNYLNRKIDLRTMYANKLT